MTVKFDGVTDVQALNLPGVPEIQPVVGLLVLKAIHQKLQRGTAYHSVQALGLQKLHQAAVAYEKARDES